MDVAIYCNVFNNMYGGMVAVGLLGLGEAVAQKLNVQLAYGFQWTLRVEWSQSEMLV